MTVNSPLHRLVINQNNGIIGMDIVSPQNKNEESMQNGENGDHNMEDGTYLFILIENSLKTIL